MYLMTRFIPSQTTTFTGESGKEYEFTVYSKSAQFPDISAVYIFVERILNDKTDELWEYIPLYIGESTYLGKRIANHDKWKCVNDLGCTHILIKEVSEDDREDIEKDLIKGIMTFCNEEPMNLT